MCQKITRKTCTKCGVEKDLEEFTKQKGGKYGKASQCRACIKITRDANKEEANARRRESYKENREVILASCAKYRDRNREELAAKQRIYRTENLEAIRGRSKESQQKYRRNNLTKYAAWRAKRRAAQLQRTPAWLTRADHLLIEELYRIAEQLEKQTGEKHHVDHIVPLQGVNVSGFHHPDNLQILPARENLSKNNSYIPVPTIDYINT